jgi:elongator complex protein 1
MYSCGIPEGEACKLLPHLCRCTEEHRTEGESLQDDLIRFSQELKEAIEEIWSKPPGGGNDVSMGAADSWAKRMEQLEKESHISAVEKIAQPEIGQMDWGVWRAMRISEIS